jgi:hypothetical protein
VVEEMANAAAGAFDDFARALGSTDAGILRADAYTFANVACAFHGMEGDDVDCALAGAFGDIAGGSTCAFADVARPGSYVAAWTTGGWYVLLCLRRRGCGLLLLCVDARASEGAGGEHEESGKDDTDVGAHEAKSPRNWMLDRSMGLHKVRLVRVSN